MSEIISYHCPKCGFMLSNIYLPNLDSNPIIDYEKRTLTFKCQCKEEITIPLCPYYDNGCCTYWSGCIMGYDNFCVAHSYETDEKFSSNVSKEDKEEFYETMKKCFTFKKNTWNKKNRRQVCIMDYDTYNFYCSKCEIDIKIDIIGDGDRDDEIDKEDYRCEKYDPR